MKFFIFVIFVLTLSTSFSQITEITENKEIIGLFKEIVTSDVAKEWSKKLGDPFSRVSSVTKKYAKYAGPAGDLLTFALSVVEEHPDEAEQNKTLEYLMNITMQLEIIDSKLDAISEQITSLDSKLTQSTKKVLAELKFRDFLLYLEEMVASKQHYEAIISSFTSNSEALVVQLDKFIEDYRQKGSDTKLVNILDSGSGITNSIVDDLISVSRSYHKDNLGASGSSTMKTIFDVYITAFMAVLKANVVLDSAVNLKTAITGKYFEEDRRYNHYRKNEIMEKFFESLKKTFSKLNDDDMDGFIDFSITGDNNKVRLINVIQYFWENEDKLSAAGGVDTCTDNCEHFKNRRFNGGGCYGSARDCKYGVKLYHTERYLRQSPQYDRIYDGYVLNHKWYGYGIDDESDPNMEMKKSYLRGFVNCHVCKCECDQHSNPDSVRKFYTGKISAPDGYVVTGIKIVQHNKAIYPQTQVGKLLPMAIVDQNSVYWLDLPTDNDFFAFSYENHGIEFGDPSTMTIPDGVVTGVQFKETYFGVKWAIYGQELVDFNRGILGDEKQIETDGSSSSIDLRNTIPGLSDSSRKFTITKNAKITFGISNEDKDAGQSFVPYFDGNEIAFDIRSPLSGITLIQYSNDGDYAGYIRPVIRSLDYRKFFSTSYEGDKFVPLNYQEEVEDI